MAALRRGLATVAEAVHAVGALVTSETCSGLAGQLANSDSLVACQLDFGSKENSRTCLSCNRDNGFFGLAKPSQAGSGSEAGSEGFGMFRCCRFVPTTCFICSRRHEVMKKVRTMFTGGMPPGGRMPGFWVSAPSIIPAFRDSVLC